VALCNRRQGHPGDENKRLDVPWPWSTADLGGVPAEDIYLDPGAAISVTAGYGQAVTKTIAASGKDSRRDVCLRLSNVSRLPLRSCQPVLLY
jgi:hypothetical protein